MIMHLVSEPDGDVLDTLTVNGGAVSYDTGHAKEVVRSVAKRAGSKARALRTLAKNGWSNGYLTIKPADETITKSADTVAAGLVVYAADTGRVLMLQRHNTPDDPAGGFWEFPGGRLDGNETPLAAARREWAEETGLTVPAGRVKGSWQGKNGIYNGYVLTIPHETDLPILDGRQDGANPDDPDGDETEALAWWDPDQLKNNPAVRPEVLNNRKRMLRAVRDGNTITKSITIDKCLTCGCDMPADDHGDHRHITMQDINDAAAAAGISPAQAWHNLREATPAAVTGGPPEIVKVDEGAAGDYKARHLIQWFNHGADGRIDWGGPGDYDACVRVASEHMKPGIVHGFCANRHHDALGEWPATHAAQLRGKKAYVADWTGLGEPDLVKVGPKGYVHGWIHVGPVDIGGDFHHPTHGKGTITHLDEHGHVHVRFTGANGKPKYRQFQHIDHPTATGSGRRGVHGNDDFTRHMRAAAAASRRKDYATAADRYRQAAEATTHPKLRQDMLDRAARDTARAAPPIAVHTPGSGKFSPGTTSWAQKVRGSLPKTRDEWDASIPRAANIRIDTMYARHADEVARLEQARKHLERIQADNGTSKYELATARSDVEHHAEEVTRRAEALAAERLKPGPKWYPIDPGSGQLMPSDEMNKHLDKIMDVGRTALNEIQAEFEADPAMKALIADQERYKPELDALIKERDRIWDTARRDMPDKSEQFSAITAKIAGHRSSRVGREQAVRRREAEIIRQMLGAHRPFGGVSHDNARTWTGDEAKRRGFKDAYGARKDWKKRLADAEKSYPDEWLQMSKDRDPLTLISAKRAYQNERYGVLAMPSMAQDVKYYDGAFKDYTAEVNVHELGHRMETAVPGLTHMEFAFVRRAATKGGVVEQPQSLKKLYPTSSYRPEEMAIKDEFANAYVGKTYEAGSRVMDPGTAPWEVFQTGTQDVFGRSSYKLGNDELQAFVIGTLLTLG